MTTSGYRQVGPVTHRSLGLGQESQERHDTRRRGRGDDATSRQRKRLRLDDSGAGERDSRQTRDETLEEEWERIRKNLSGAEEERIWGRLQKEASAGPVDGAELAIEEAERVTATFDTYWKAHERQEQQKRWEAAMRGCERYLHRRQPSKRETKEVDRHHETTKQPEAKRSSERREKRGSIQQSDRGETAAWEPEHKELAHTECPQPEEMEEGEIREPEEDTLQVHSGAVQFQRQYNCSLCDVNLNSAKQHHEHLRGKKHGKKLVQEEEIPPPTWKRRDWRDSSEMHWERETARGWNKRLTTAKIEGQDHGPFMPAPLSPIPAPIPGENRLGQDTNGPICIDLNLSVSTEHVVVPTELQRATENEQTDIKQEINSETLRQQPKAPKVVSLFGVQILVEDEGTTDSDAYAKEILSNREKHVQKSSKRERNVNEAENYEEANNGNEEEGSDTEKNEQEDTDDESYSADVDDLTEAHESSEEENGTLYKDGGTDKEENIQQVREQRRKLLATLAPGDRQICKTVNGFKSVPPFLLTPEERRARWNAKYAQVKQFYVEHGRVPTRADSNSLWNWLAYSRKAWSTLAADQTNKLTEIGVGPIEPRRPRKTNTTAATCTAGLSRWDKRRAVSLDGTGWKERFAELKNYRKATGNNPPYFIPVGRWLYEQIALQNADLLNAERKELLEGVGVQWGFAEDAGPNDSKPAAEDTEKGKQHNKRKRIGWRQRFDELVRYRAEHNNAEPPKGSALYTWLRNQRYRMSTKQLSDTRVVMLLAEGITLPKASSTPVTTKAQKALY